MAGVMVRRGEVDWMNQGMRLMLFFAAVLEARMKIW
jgi:hypothetical protein